MSKLLYWLGCDTCNLVSVFMSDDMLFNLFVFWLVACPVCVMCRVAYKMYKDEIDAFDE